jgi:hypothetical protein
MVIDSTRIRKKALSNLGRAQTTFKKAERELTVFEEEDQPAFKRWYRTQFGPLIEEIKTTLDRTNELRERIHRISRFADRYGCTTFKAGHLFENARSEFERIEAEMEERLKAEQQRWEREEQERRQNFIRDILFYLEDFVAQNEREIRYALRAGTPKSDILERVLDVFSMQSRLPVDWIIEQLQTPQGAEILEEYGLKGALEEYLEECPEGAESMEDAFEEFLKSQGVFDNGEDDYDLSDNSSNPQQQTAQAYRENRLKVLWRELAFSLHPDQSESSDDPRKIDLWYQVQEAMEQKDVDRLEVLHAHMQILCGVISTAAPVSKLLELTNMIRSSRDALRRRIRSLRRCPEWGFARADQPKSKKLYDSLRRQLRQELAEHQHTYNSHHAYYREYFAPRNHR